MTLCLLLTLIGCSPAEQSNIQPEKANVQPRASFAPSKTLAPSGTYELDKSHASLLFRVDHIGFSKYTARFSNFDATLRLDTDNPSASVITATVDTNSLGLENPPSGFLATLLGKQWLDAGTYPFIKFRSESVTLTSPNTANITGTLELLGKSRPITLFAIFNGGYAGHPMDPHGRVGFSVSGSFSRSDFGIVYGLPPKGTTMGVGDVVEVIIEAEFNGPPLAPQ